MVEYQMWNPAFADDSDILQKLRELENDESRLPKDYYDEDNLNQE